MIKRFYNSGAVERCVVITAHLPYFLARHAAKWLIRKPHRHKRRGMGPWRGFIGWLGGYPFEVARPETILSFYRAHGFILESMTTVDGRHGCNEYVLPAHLSGA